MISGLTDFAMPLLRTLDPERAHELTILAMENGLYPRQCKADDPRLRQKIGSLEFPNPIGIAAGFDKDGRVPEAVLKSGFGFAEVGTVTPEPQSGNLKPRIFRLSSDQAMINRLGFNNEGHSKALARMKQRRGGGIIGVNIGANKDSADREADYLAGLEAFSEIADYLTVNISSPNTPGLRDLQGPEELDRLLTKLMVKRSELLAKGIPLRPIAVKLSPDIADDDIAPICEKIATHGVDGLIISNTTLDRTGLRGTGNINETGGLSGAPLYERSTRLLAKVYVQTKGRIPLIGVGGIHSGETALGKIEAGASLIQIYTGLVYEGPALVGRIKQALLAEIERAGVNSISDLIGTKSEDWAAKT